MKSKIERLQDKIAKKEAELQKEKEKLQNLLTDTKTRHSVTQYKEQFKALGAEIKLIEGYVSIKAIDEQKDENFIETWLPIDDELESKIEKALDNLKICRKLENTYGRLKFSVSQIEDESVLIQDDTDEVYKITVNMVGNTYVGSVTKENADYVYKLEQVLTDKLSLVIESEYDGFDLVWAYVIHGDLEELPKQIDEAIQVLKNYKAAE